MERIRLNYNHFNDMIAILENLKGSILPELRPTEGISNDRKWTVTCTASVLTWGGSGKPGSPAEVAETLLTLAVNGPVGPQEAEEGCFA